MMMNSYFPFGALGFRGNPFRAVTDEEWRALAVVPMVVQNEARRGGHLQLTGEAGRGKTSALLGLAELFASTGARWAYVYLPEGVNTLASDLRGVEVLLLDEAQRLSRRERERLMRLVVGGVRAVLATHESFAPLFTRHGLPLASVALDDCDEAHWRAVLERRLNYFSTDGRSSPLSLSDDDVRYLRERFGGNLRAGEQYLYEVFQRYSQSGVWALT